MVPQAALQSKPKCMHISGSPTHVQGPCKFIDSYATKAKSMHINWQPLGGATTCAAMLVHGNPANKACQLAPPAMCAASDMFIDSPENSVKSMHVY